MFLTRECSRLRDRHIALLTECMSRASRVLQTLDSYEVDNPMPRVAANSPTLLVALQRYATSHWYLRGVNSITTERFRS